MSMYMILLFALVVVPIHSVHGVATYYTYDMYGGNHLYCSTIDNPLRYTTELMASYDWVAVDVKHYRSGAMRCGDTLRVTFLDGTVIDVLAWDAGPFSKYYIEDWPDLPILVDFEESAWPYDDRMSAVVDAVNISGEERKRKAWDCLECHPCYQRDFHPGGCSASW